MHINFTKQNNVYQLLCKTIYIKITKQNKCMSKLLNEIIHIKKLLHKIKHNG